MLLTGPEFRVLQIHPSRHCNLSCIHCYSSSGPELRFGLPASLLEAAIRDAQGLGYNMLSISGGEPLLYPELSTLLRTGKESGMLTALVTNGILLGPRKLEEIRDLVDVVAISLDGAPSTHNRMRNAAQAFEQMHVRLPGLRAAEIPFGFVFTLTADNLHELEWAAAYAAAQKAALLQVHPLERVGRAEALDARVKPTGYDGARAWLVLQVLQQLYAGQLQITLDLLRSGLAGSVTQSAGEKSSCDAPLGYRLSPLVVEPDGAVVPLQYGFPQSFALGNLHDAPLSSLAEVWLRERSALFSALSRTVTERIKSSTDLFVKHVRRNGARSGQADNLFTTEQRCETNRSQVRSSGVTLWLHCALFSRGIET
jgi:Fe-coproporphyrin III synthase